MNIGKPERATQDRIISLFHDELGYSYLGNWIDREGNSNIEEELLAAYLTKNGYTHIQIGVALHLLKMQLTAITRASTATTRQSIAFCATASL